MTFHEKRMEICKSCEHFKAVLGDKVAVCGECGCLMQLKVRFKDAYCPKEKWSAEA